MTKDVLPIKRALISVTDKSGLPELAAKLKSLGVEIISSGGTGKFLQEHGFEFTPIEKVTGNPECFGGRVKTLSFQVSGAILFRRDHADDVADAKKLGITPIDMCVVNLYPFETVAKKSNDWDEIVENIDIGGPTLIRAASKNYHHVAVVTDPSQYGAIMRDLNETGGAVRADTLEVLSMEAFRHTARYDGMIAAKFEEKRGEALRTVVLSPKDATPLRYGENPHQKSWVYRDTFNAGLAGAEPLQGKELSYNNMLDADAAWRCCGDIASLSLAAFPAAVAIIKHLSPCGVALAKTPLAALETAWAGDPVSSFGGIVAFNQPVGEDVAKWLDKYMVEVVIAPSYAEEAKKVFAAKKNLRLLEMKNYDGSYKPPIVRSISGGWLLQDEDTGVDAQFTSMTGKAFPADKTDLARFGIMACKHLKSNAIGLFKSTQEHYTMVGAGMGNPNRVVSVKQAIEKAHENGCKELSEIVLVSDAFFPFPDNIVLASGAGIRYIVQPGGSIRDKDVINACEEGDIAMSFTGRRHFRH